MIRASTQGDLHVGIVVRVQGGEIHRVGDAVSVIAALEVADEFLLECVAENAHDVRLIWSAHDHCGAPVGASGHSALPPSTSPLVVVRE